MTRLLISVRNAFEARAALAGGAHIIDVKEPRRGSLGRADDRVIHEIFAEVGEQAGISVACGELGRTQVGLKNSARPPVRRCPDTTQAAAAYAKIGLQGALASDWQTTWRNWRDDLPPGFVPVLVAYADAGPSIGEFIRFAESVRPAAFLIDTAHKDGRWLGDHVNMRELKGLIALVQSTGVPVALAGSLTPSTIVDIKQLLPDIIAVRGAACDGARDGTVSTDRVRELARLVT